MWAPPSIRHGNWCTGYRFPDRNPFRVFTPHSSRVIMCRMCGPSLLVSLMVLVTCMVPQQNSKQQFGLFTSLGAVLIKSKQRATQSKRGRSARNYPALKFQAATRKYWAEPYRLDKFAGNSRSFSPQAPAHWGPKAASLRSLKKS